MQWKFDDEIISLLIFYSVDILILVKKNLLKRIELNFIMNIILMYINLFRLLIILNNI